MALPVVAVNRTVWPFHLFCTVLPITEVDGYRIIQRPPLSGIRKALAYGVLMFVLSLLALSVYSRYQGDVAAALAYAGAFVTALLSMLVLALLSTRCKRCRRRMRFYERPHFPHQGSEYRLSGWKCDHCKEVDIRMCVNMALESM